MKGTEKQIKWAEKIMAQKIAEARQCYEAYKDQATISPDKVMAIFEKAASRLTDTHDNAAWWIDHRNDGTEAILGEIDALVNEIYSEKSGEESGEDTNRRLNEIIDRLNELYNQECDLGEYILDVALDVREEQWEGECPPPTEEELAVMQTECDKNAEIAKAISEEQLELIAEYSYLTGTTPYHGEIGGYLRSWYEKSIDD